MTIQNDAVALDFANLTEDQRDILARGKAAGGAEKARAAAEERVKTAREQIADVLKPYEGQLVPDSIRTLTITGFMMGRVNGLKYERALEIVTNGVKTAEATELQRKAHNSGKMTLSRAAKDVGALLDHANAGNDHASKPKDETPKDETPKDTVVQDETPKLGSPEAVDQYVLNQLQTMLKTLKGKAARPHVRTNVLKLIETTEKSMTEIMAKVAAAKK